MASQNYPLIDSHRHPTLAQNSSAPDYYPQSFTGCESDPGRSGSVAPPSPDDSTTAGKRRSYCYKDGVDADDSNTAANKRQKPTGNMDPPAGSPAEYRKDREEWSDAAIARLLEAYTEKFNQLNRGNLRGRDWEEVAEAVSEGCGGGGGRVGDEKQKIWKSVEQCKNKIDNLKKRYKVELQRMSSSGVPTSHWHWFKQIEAIMGSSPSSRSSDIEERGAAGGVSSSFPPQTKRYSQANGCGNSLKLKPVQNLKWRRVVFEISGTAMAGNCQTVDPKVATQIAREVATACRLGLEVAIVVGGGNFFCGDLWVSTSGLDRSTAYQFGMMATIMNSLLLQSALEKLGVQTCVQSTFTLPEVAEPYNKRRAIRHLEKGRVVIFGGVGAGIANPLFSTDTAAAFRAFEINAEAVIKGVNIDGIYDCDSRNGNVRLDHISFRDAASRAVTAIDTMAVTYCEDNGIPVVIFNMLEPGNISKALCGEAVGTLIDQMGKIS